MHNTAMNRPVESESVRLKAYELWVNGGKRDGVAVQNWIEAERLLRTTESSTSPQSLPKSVPAETSARVDVSVPAASTHSDSSPVPGSTPPASAVVSAPNKTNQKAPAKANGFQNGRKR